MREKRKIGDVISDPIEKEVTKKSKVSVGERYFGLQVSDNKRRPVFGIPVEFEDQFKELCKEHQVTVLVRPTERESLYLMERGFATKSTDIHSKSAVSGLLSGFVPWDPSFNKKADGANQYTHNDNPPNPGEKDPHHPDFAAETVHHYLTNEIIDDYIEYGKVNELTYAELPSELPADIREKIADKNPRFFRSTTQDTNVLHITLEDEHDPNKQRVYYFNQQSQKLVPHIVWGYEGVPATGDVDIFCMAFKANPDSIIKFAVVGEGDEYHGESVISWAGFKFMKAANEAFKGKDIFRHGAEIDNFDFAQGLDKLLHSWDEHCSNNVNRNSLADVIVKQMQQGFYIPTNPNFTKGRIGFSGKQFSSVDDFVHTTKSVRKRRSSKEYRMWSLLKETVLNPESKSSIADQHHAEKFVAKLAQGINDALKPTLGNNEPHKNVSIIKQISDLNNQYARAMMKVQSPQGLEDKEGMAEADRILFKLYLLSDELQKTFNWSDKQRYSYEFQVLLKFLHKGAFTQQEFSEVMSNDTVNCHIAQSYEKHLPQKYKGLPVMPDGFDRNLLLKIINNSDHIPLKKQLPNQINSNSVFSGVGLFNRCDSEEKIDLPSSSPLSIPSA